MGMTPEMGQLVSTRDGHELGVVKELRDDAFKVDVAMKRDYWLSVGSILSMTGDGIVMDFDEETLDAYELDEPEGQLSESPIIDAAGDTFVSTEDRDLRRERNIRGGGGADE